MDSYKTPTVLGPPYQDVEDLSFFKSLIPTVKTLRQDQKMNFRINVMEMLKDLTTPSLLMTISDGVRSHTVSSHSTDASTYLSQ